jgi:hypothetical protein
VQPRIGPHSHPRIGHKSHKFLHGLAAEFVTAGDPVISVDTKKKEMVGEYANGGVEWQPAGQPVRVNVHDFVGL